MTGHDQPGPGQQGERAVEPELSREVGRRGFLKGVGALGAAGVAGLAAPALAGRPAVAGRVSRARSAGATPLEHVIIDCHENRSFDHYFGFAPFAGSAGVPPGYSQPDGNGGTVAPFEFTSLSTPDIDHSWSAVHSEWEVGMGIQQQLITALQESSAWESSAYILTYDEAGGYFDHVAPPQFDAYGAGVRVPTWVISPHAKKSHLETTVYEHTSTLKFIEAVFGLPTLASVNHRFDESTPGGPNNEASGGQPTGPPAPPRDDRPEIGNLMECFTF